MSGLDEERSGEKPAYEFAEIGHQLIRMLLKSAEDRVVEAQNLLGSTKTLTEGIEAQIREHAQMLDNMNGRLKTFGEEVLGAHTKYINGK